LIQAYIEYLSTISTIATILTLIVALLKNKTLMKEMRVLFLYVFLSSVIDAVIFSLAKFKMHNLFLMNGFILVQLILLGFYYRKVFETRKSSSIIIVVLICFCGLYIWESTLLDRKEGLYIYSLAIESIVLMCFSLVCFYWLIKKVEYESIFQNPVFWVNSSVLIYFSGNLFLFIFSNYILQQPDNRIWIFHSILNILFNTLLIVAFWKTSKKLT
jgi:hypothetical protein